MKLLKWLVLVPVAVVMVPVLALFALLVVIDWPPWPPADEEMLRLFGERRAQFEELVTKVRQESRFGTIHLDYVSSGLVEGKFVAEVRTLLRAAGVRAVMYGGRSDSIVMTYRAGGFVDAGWYKDFIYRPAPLEPPPKILDLSGKDAADLARAALCYRDRREDLRHLCRDKSWVSSLDVMDRYDDLLSDWEAERPIDAHWSIRLWRTR